MKGKVSKKHRIKKFSDMEKDHEEYVSLVWDLPYGVFSARVEMPVENQKKTVKSNRETKDVHQSEPYAEDGNSTAAELSISAFSEYTLILHMTKSFCNKHFFDTSNGPFQDDISTYQVLDGNLNGPFQDDTSNNPFSDGTLSDPLGDDITASPVLYDLSRRPILGLYWWNQRKGGYDSVRLSPKSYEIEDYEERKDGIQLVLHIPFGAPMSGVYRKGIHFIREQYYSYVNWKLLFASDSYSKTFEPYPDHWDNVLDRSFREFYDRQMVRKDMRAFLKWFAGADHDYEIALSLENYPMYKAFLAIEEREEASVRANFRTSGAYEGLRTPAGFKDAGLSGALENKRASAASYGPLAIYNSNYKRVYIGNSWCRFLFPEEELLWQLIGKAASMGKAVTIVLPLLQTELEEETEAMLHRLLCEDFSLSMPLEFVVNDLGVLYLLSGLREQLQADFTISAGLLLEKRRRDPRMKYLKLETKQLAANQFGQKAFVGLLRKYGVSRFECSSGGYEADYPEGVTLHLPVYQVNTGQTCGLRALARSGNRARQEQAHACCRYCERMSLAYPKHMNMVGVYNSLFAVDEEFVSRPELWIKLKDKGVDRLVFNLQEVIGHGE